MSPRTESLIRRAERPWRLVILQLGLAACGLLVACGKAPSPTSASSSKTAPVQSLTTGASAVARGHVDIEGGIIRLAARRDGIIAKVLVEEGERVRAGQVLATLDDDLARRNLALAEREVEQAEQESRKTRIELAAAEREVKRLEPLAAKETVPLQDLDLARDVRALADVACHAAAAAIETARARQAVAARELEERQIIAPLDGQIIQRQARPGNGVSTLNVTPLFLFTPDVPRIVRAELEEQYLESVRIGQPAQVILQAQPERTWSGKVLRIGRVVGERTPTVDPKERQDNQVVEVVITLEGADALIIGQRVVVRFLGGSAEP